MNLILPWPPTALSPNTRQHWAALAKAKREFKAACMWTAKEQGAKPMHAERLDVSFVFVPPSRRRIDLDNCIARMKSGIDGLSLVLGVDDSKWAMTFSLADEIGGMVRVNVKEKV